MILICSLFCLELKVILPKLVQKKQWRYCFILCTCVFLKLKIIFLCVSWSDDCIFIWHRIKCKKTILASSQFWPSTGLGHAPCLRTVNNCYIFIQVYPSWTKYATNILKNIYILILMAQFHNAPSWELGLIGYRNPQVGSESWKKQFFKQNR